MRRVATILIAAIALGASGVGPISSRQSRPRNLRIGGRSPGRFRAMAGPQAARSIAMVPAGALSSMSAQSSASAIATAASPMTTRSIASPIST
jgi:hypothetical protein